MSADAVQTLAALRLYFPVASKASARRFWHSPTGAASSFRGEEIRH